MGVLAIVPCGETGAGEVATATAVGVAGAAMSGVSGTGPHAASAPASDTMPSIGRTTCQGARFHLGPLGTVALTGGRDQRDGKTSSRLTNIFTRQEALAAPCPDVCLLGCLLLHASHAAPTVHNTAAPMTHRTNKTVMVRCSRSSCAPPTWLRATGATLHRGTPDAHR